MPPFTGTTHITAILDRSGSMAGLVEETVAAYNRWLADLKVASRGQDTIFTLKLFDDEHLYPHRDIPIRNAKKLTSKVYFARGMTALFDALGQEADYLKGIVKKKDRAILLCMTDGHENASHEYDRSRLSRVLGAIEEAPNFSIQFIGANMNAQAVGMHIGLRHQHGVTRTNDYVGTQSAFAASSLASGQMMGGLRAMNETVTQGEYDTIADEIAKNPPKKPKPGLHVPK